MKIQSKIMALGASLTVITAGVIVAILLLKQSAMQHRVLKTGNDVEAFRASMDRELRAMMRSEIGRTSQEIRSGFEAADKRTGQRLAQSLAVVLDQIKSAGGLHLGNEPVSWQCVNQFTRETRQETLPRMMLGTNWLGQNRSTNTESPVVDLVTRITHDYSTVFQRINDEGDMVRVCTSVVSTNGLRAIGTFIPRRNPDGQENPVVASVLKGETYHGRAFVVNDWNEAAYEPVWDADHKKVVGMVFVGVPLANINRDLLKHVKEIVLGKSGYAFILQGKGDQRGLCLAHKELAREGTSFWNLQDTAGRPFIQSIISKALEARNGSAAFEQYLWKPGAGEEARPKIAAISYYEPWDWVICVSAYEDELLQVNQQVEMATGNLLANVTDTLGQLKAATGWVMATAAAIITLSLVIGYFIARAISRPLREGVNFARHMAEGDLTQHFELRRNDELGELAKAMDAMGTNLRQMFRTVASSAKSVTDASQSLGAVSTQVTANSEEASAQCQAVADTAQQVSTNVSTVASAAEQMSSSVKEIARQAAHASKVVSQAVTLTDATNATMAKLDISSSQIGTVIQVITSIAEQTNLLALNATIEAARAGEAGKGFAVVANEVKELARQTAKATGDISHTIASIQGDSRNAVQALQQIGSTIKQIDEIQTTIAGAVEEQAATTNEISQNVNEAARGSAGIARNIANVVEVARNSSQAAANTALAAEELAGLAGELNTAVARFKIGDPGESKSDGTPLPYSSRRASHPVFHSENEPIYN